MKNTIEKTDDGELKETDGSRDDTLHCCIIDEEEQCMVPSADSGDECCCCC